LNEQKPRTFEVNQEFLGKEPIMPGEMRMMFLIDYLMIGRNRRLRHLETGNVRSPLPSLAKAMIGQLRNPG
jgi:hypothetical protein